MPDLGTTDDGNAISEITPLITQTLSSQSYNRPCCHRLQSSYQPCEHGTTSPHASPPVSPDRSGERYGYGALDEWIGPGTSNDHNGDGGGGNDDDNGNIAPTGYRGRYTGKSDLQHGILEDAVAEGVLGDDVVVVEGGDGGEGGEQRDGGGKGVHSTTQYLARRYGVKGRRKMYLTYYFPFLNWITQYRWSYLQGDLVAALTMASFYIPMSLSYAENLGHLPPINGLYSFVFNPFVYAFLGTCPQMVVGPEAAGSLLVGAVVRTSVDKGAIGDEDDDMNARVAGVVTGMAGAVIFIAGLTRLGFLDSVLSRPFLRGFISAIGFVILVDQLIPEMGLTKRAKHVGVVGHGSSAAKLVFLMENIRRAHGLTSGVAFGSFAIIMVCRYVVSNPSKKWGQRGSMVLTIYGRQLKKHMQPRYPKVAYIPDRFIVVVLSAVFTWKFDWDKKGLAILGNVQSSTGSAFPFRFPFILAHMEHVREAMSTSFLIALLGFFESSVAAKSLGGGEGRHGEGIQGVSLSANRELVALGVANIIGGCFMALPAFGGYGRSKVNASTGGRTPMSSIFLSLLTLICVLSLLPYFYYLPVSVYSAAPLTRDVEADNGAESCFISNDISGRILISRRSASRHYVFHHRSRLVRTDIDANHLRFDYILLAFARHCSGSRPFRTSGDSAFNET